MVVVKLRCNKCGHERLMTTKWLEAIGINLLPSNSKILYNKIYKLLPRFKCSECKAKGAKFIYQRVNINNKKNVSNSHVENILRKKGIPKSSWRKPPSSTTICPKGIPGYTVNVSSSFQTQHDMDSAVNGVRKLVIIVMGQVLTETALIVVELDGKKPCFSGVAQGTI